MSKRGHAPIRTCIGCRKKKRKEELIWFVQGIEGVIRVTGKKFHQGRGFYLCPNIGCLNMAKKKNKGIGFMKTMDFGYPSKKGFFKEVKGSG